MEVVQFYFPEPVAGRVTPTGNGYRCGKNDRQCFCSPKGLEFTQPRATPW